MSPSNGRAALVTGAGSGIGRACALRLAADGFAVALVGRDRARLSAVADRIADAGGRAAAYTADVSDADAVRAAVAAATAELGAPHVVVANAGIAESAKFTDITPEMWRRTFDVNVTGAFLAVQACLPPMLAAKTGRVVVIGSTASVQGFPWVVHYTASKHAVLGMVRALALEVAARGVTVNCVCPGYVDTELTQRSVDQIVRTTGRTPQDARRALESASPQKRLMTPDEVAETVSWLCGDAAAGVNGQAIVVNGG